jgi:hypothetical protein
VAALRGLGWLSVDADECGDEDSVCAAQSIAAKIRERRGRRVMDKREMVSVEEAREILDASPDLGAAVETGCGVLDNALTGGRQPFDLVIRAMDLLRDVERLARAVIALRAEHAAALDAARREGAEGMRWEASEAAEQWLREVAEVTEDSPADLADAIRALPLDAPGGGS